MHTNYGLRAGRVNTGCGPLGKYSPAHDWFLDLEIANVIQKKAYQLSRSTGFSHSDQPDIEQEFRLHLWRKAAKFNADRSKPITFAMRLIERKAASMARKVDAGKRSYRRNSISLNKQVIDSKGDAYDVADLFDESACRRHTGQRSRSPTELAHLRLDLAEANRHLPPPLKRLAALLSHVAEYPAGQVLGMSRRQTARGVDKLREFYAARGLAG